MGTRPGAGRRGGHSQPGRDPPGARGSGTVEELAEKHRFLAYDEIAGAEITRRSPIRADLKLHNGATVALEQRWTADTLGDSQDTLLAVLDRLAAKG